MRVLHIAPHVPFPLSSGGRVRTYNLLHHMQNKYEIHLACFTKPDEFGNIEHITGLCNSIYPIARPSSPSGFRLGALALSSYPILVRFFTSLDARETIKSLLLNYCFDIIHIETYYLYFNLPIDRIPPVVLAEFNIEYLLMRQMVATTSNPFLRAAYRMDAWKQFKWERHVWKNVEACVAVSKEDAKVIQHETQHPTIKVVKNGVDPTVKASRSNASVQTPNILFVGTFLYRPNVDGVRYFLDEIFPLILSKVPDICFEVVGDTPPKLLTKYQHPSNVKFHGYVENIDELFQTTQVSICPIRIGSGSRVKILEALLRGHPVVSTRIGAKGLDLEPQVDIMICDTAAEFAESVCQLLSSVELRQRLGRHGRTTVIKKYNWAQSAENLSTVYENLRGFRR